MRVLGQRRCIHHRGTEEATSLWPRTLADEQGSNKPQSGNPCLSVKSGRNELLRRLLRRRWLRSRSLLWLGNDWLGFGFGRVRLGRRLRLGRRQNEVQRVALLPRTKLHDRLVAQVLDQALQNSTSQTLAGHLASAEEDGGLDQGPDRKSTRLNSSHLVISYAVF